MASPIGNLIHPNEPRLPQPLSSHPNTPAPFSLAPLVLPPSRPVSGAPPNSFSGPTVTQAQPTETPRSHSNTQSLYQCADCLRRYSRPEHLQRHIATHTLGKRFTCDICTKAFSRADLLKRHRANHQDDNGTKRRRINSSPGAGRVAHACQACAKARVKCEETKPCSRCRNRGLYCEHASSEDAAMHLLHLSAKAHNMESEQSTISPDSPCFAVPPPGAPRPLRQASQTLPPHPTMANPPLVAQALTSSPVVMSNPPMKEESQLPTPEVLMDRSNVELDDSQSSYANASVLDISKLPFSDFLRDVLSAESLQDPSKTAEAQGLAVLDFCDNADLELRDGDFSLLDYWNVDDMPARGPNVAEPQPGPEDAVDMNMMHSKLVKIWTQSPWRWNPGKMDNNFREQSNLPLTAKDMSSGSQMQGGSGIQLDRVVQEKLSSSGRDQILAIVLETCRITGVDVRVASSFPSTEVMDSWIHVFLAAQLCEVSSWVHYGSLSLSTQWPEWLAITAAAGAVLTPVPTLRRFGFALLEAVRSMIPTRFEANNRAIADLGLVQSFLLAQDIGLWSGNRRKMEISEAFWTIPIAMVRYRNKFQRSTYPGIVLDPSDEGEVLRKKWKEWYELESWKRLIFHTYLRDAQVSMTQLCNPTMSYAELTLPLPCSRELWFARTAEEFKIRYFEIRADQDRRPPSLGDLFRDINLLSANHQWLDVQFSISIYLHGFWSLIWEYRQLSSIFRSASSHSAGLSRDPNNLLSLRRQELCDLLRGFQLVTRDWHEMLSAQGSIVLHLLLMNLHVSLDDLQIFSGKEGEDQARRVYPTLQRWSTGEQARCALWHAGQILRQAKLFPPGHLKDFYAIAVHHAALCLWTHSIVSRASSRARMFATNDGSSNISSTPLQQQQHQQPTPGHGSSIFTSYNSSSSSSMVIYLDDEDTAAVRRFISHNEGRAAIRRPRPRRGPAAAARTTTATATTMVEGAESPVADARGCMEVAQEILRANFPDCAEMLPPINENIVHLLRQLGDAALAVGLG